MKISELSPDLRPSSDDRRSSNHQPLRPLLEDLEASVQEVESLSPDSSSAERITGLLRSSLSRLSSSASAAAPLPEPTKLHLWKLSYRLWNACVDLSNAAELRPHGSSKKADHAELRQIASDILIIAGIPAGVPSAVFKTASLFYKTGLAWHELGRFDLAAVCFERATDLTSSVAKIDGVPQIGGDEERRLLLDVSLARARTAWEASDRALAIGLLNRSKNLTFGSPVGFRTLAEQYLQFGKSELSKKPSDREADASKLLNEALDICEKGITVARGRAGGGAITEVVELEGLKQRCLRFLAAERLQAEDYEGVLRCVRVLRTTTAKAVEDEHPSISYAAMRAWIGAGRVAEAERELMGMMANKEAPEAACVSAAEAYLSAVGPEAARPVLLGLLDRCRAGAMTALRVVRRVAEGGGKGRAKVAAELAADERVVALFEGTAATKERNAMHALLWNCGAENFRSKEYEFSADMMERSMLYVPRNEENRSRRANCFRVLCLCHLALGQLDRAQEFINEADKLEPNVKCAFLKFKICLQNKYEKEAINQMQAMVDCIDFNPEFLTLSTHEAIACKSLPVAISSLSFLLSLYIPGKQMPMPEVAVLRNLIALLYKSTENEKEILKYIGRACARMTDLGAETFFGAGAVGSRELNWFAGNSWNMGLKTAKEKKYELCAEFFELASVFYDLVADENSGNQDFVCKSLILSASAILNSEEQKKVRLPDADIKRAFDMLNKASKILNSISSSVHVVGEKQNENSSLLFLHAYSSYQLSNRLHDDGRPQQLQLIKTFASSRECTPHQLLQLGLAACQGEQPNIEAAGFALNSCLSALLSSASPNYHLVSIVLRKLACLAAFHNNIGDKNHDAYGVYKQAYQIIVGLKEGEYPIDEGKWLAMSAWNKSGLAIRLRQVSVARRWMKIGLDLARHLKGMEKYIGGMEDCVANFEKLFAGSCGDSEGGEFVSR